MEIFEKSGGDMNGTINVGIVTGKLDNQNAVERCQGYEEQLKNYANATIVDEQVGAGTGDDAMAIAENWITSRPRYRHHPLQQRRHGYRHLSCLRQRER